LEAHGFRSAPIGTHPLSEIVLFISGLAENRCGSRFGADPHPDFTGPPVDPLPLPFQLQDPERLRQELATAGLKGIEVETITETTGFQSGKELWDWLVWSNPIVEMVLGGLNLTGDERGVIQQALEKLVRERARGSGPAVLTNPINIGIGTK
jgi:hypothetical protein